MIIANQWAVTIYSRTFAQLNRDGLFDCLNFMTCTIRCENIKGESADSNEFVVGRVDASVLVRQKCACNRNTGFYRKGARGKARGEELQKGSKYSKSDSVSATCTQHMRFSS